MRHLVSLALVYALVTALVLPGSLLAAEEEAQPPAGDGTTAQEPAQEDQGPGEPAAQEEAPPAQEPAAQPEPEPQPAQAPPAEPAQQEAAPAQAQAPAEPAEDKREEPKARKAQSGSVTITDFKFSPASITVNVGDTVTWTNQGPTQHSATASNGSFDTGTFPRGQSRSHTFHAPGSFSYICTPHPFMKGTVTVRGASTGAGGGSGGGASDDSGDGAASSDAGAASDSGSGSALPNSGADAGALALLGLLLVALGAATRRRAAAQPPAHPGRIGW
ncbi:MAG TPA: cupredoxin family copper-binding protein [Thermoleophilaceae bacterium]|nr:cupredoxin family copper-binding protein [Thermoleophilaceae bacterium]